MRRIQRNQEKMLQPYHRRRKVSNYKNDANSSDEEKASPPSEGTFENSYAFDNTLSTKRKRAESHYKDSNDSNDEEDPNIPPLSESSASKANKDVPSFSQAKRSKGNSRAISSEEKVAQLAAKHTFKINPPPVGRPVRIYCDGIYDLFHIGHARSLEQAKKYFPEVHLMVGVCDDEVTHKKKGKTVLNEDERAESLVHCKHVDQVIRHCPWVIDQAFLDFHQIDYVAHDDIPYASSDSDDIYGFVKRQGRFLPTQRTEGISTSDIITRIIRDYNKYLLRNLERGVPPRELGISYLKEKSLYMEKSFSKFHNSIQQNWVELGNDLSEWKNDLAQTFASWEDRSQGYAQKFAGMFGVDRIFGRRSRRSLNNNNESEEDSTRLGGFSSDDDNRSRSVSP